jgi:hypothetical protein
MWQWHWKDIQKMVSNNVSRHGRDTGMHMQKSEGKYFEDDDTYYRQWQVFNMK